MAKIHGIVPPMVTPFTEDQQVDESALELDVNYLIETAEVHGLAVCGSTGEGHTLTTDETKQISAVAVNAADVDTKLLLESLPTVLNQLLKEKH